jgi:hypothetical protein
MGFTHSQPTSFDGFTINMNNTTGNVRVYGVKK